MIVGTNGSGKSSALRAIHWAVQSGCNLKVQAKRNATDGTTLSAADANYMPSPNYRNSSHSDPYRNFQNAPKLEVTLSGTDALMVNHTANLWIKAARNEGISVHIPSNNYITGLIRQKDREFSSYIPGLAGIPLQEEKRSTRIVHRQAAAGDANTVLRNLLHMLNSVSVAGEFGVTRLKGVEYWISKIMGAVALDTKFDDDRDYTIEANFQTADMLSKGQPFKPLELAGIGFLQVIQIFAYIVYFTPSSSRR